MSYLMNNMEYSTGWALGLLRAEGPDLAELYRIADRVRHEHMGDDVYIRGIIEFSNICANNCRYCGIRAGNRDSTCRSGSASSRRV